MAATPPPLVLDVDALPGGGAGSAALSVPETFALLNECGDPRQLGKHCDSLMQAVSNGFDCHAVFDPATAAAIAAMAAQYNTSGAAATTAFLSAAAASCGGTLARGPGTLVQKPILYSLLVGPPGGGKSPVMTNVTHSLMQNRGLLHRVAAELSGMEDDQPLRLSSQSSGSSSLSSSSITVSAGSSVDPLHAHVAAAASTGSQDVSSPGAGGGEGWHGGSRTRKIR